MNRKGQVDAGEVVGEWFTLMTGVLLIFGVVLILGLFIVFGFVNRGDVFEKKVLATELALAIESIPLFNDVAYFYVFTPYQFDIRIADGTIAASSDGDATATEKAMYLNDGRTMVMPSTLAPANQYIITKQGNTVEIRENSTDINPYVLPCELPANHAPLASITLDPGHGGGDTGFLFRDATEAEYTKTLARRIVSFDQSFYATSIRLDADTTTPISRRAYGQTIVSLHLSNSSASDMRLRAYIPAGVRIAENRALACSILNAITNTLVRRDIPLRGASIIPVNIEGMSIDDERAVLAMRDNAVYIEVDSIHDAQVLQNTAALATSIHDGILQYGVSTVES